jgi:hypothetical protein
MSKSNNRKIYAAVLGVAVAGFIADRTFLGGGFGPEAAGAAEAPPASVGAPASRESQARLSERVAAAFERAAGESAALVGQTPNMFDPTTAFGPAPVEQSEQQTRQALEQEFLRTHKLTALSDNAVVINGTTLQLDQRGQITQIDGYRLTGIYREGKGDMGAELVNGDVTIRLPFNPIQPEQTDR